jgi:hypothetical protein
MPDMVYLSASAQPTYTCGTLHGMTLRSHPDLRWAAARTASLGIDKAPHDWLWRHAGYG